MDRTIITDNNLSFLESGPKTPTEIIEFMKTGAKYRTFGDVLSKVWPQGLGQDEFLKRYTEISGENMQQVTANLKKWLKGANTPQSREKIFQICFALQLNEDDTNKLLGSYDDGMHIHYRNPEELVYAYALRTRLNYKEALELKERVRKQYMTAEWTAVANKNVFNRTIYVKKDFRKVDTEKALMVFLDEHIHELGAMHATAYLSFKEKIERLKNPEPDAILKQLQEEYNRELKTKKKEHKLTKEQLKVGAQQFVHKEKKYSNAKIVQEYFRGHIPDGNRTPLQAMIIRHWPNATQIGDMLKQKQDVSRKVIILLHLILDELKELEKSETELDDYYGADYEGERSFDAVLKERIGDMQAHLQSYGMNQLDPGNAFDYIVIYTLLVQVGDEYYGDRFDEVLDNLFDNEPEK